MADVKVSALAASSAPDDDDVVYIVEDGVSKQIPLSTLAAFFRGKVAVHNASTAAQSPAAATDTIIVGSTLPIPAGFLKAGTKFKVEMSVTKTAAGTGTPTVNVRFGTAGTTSDASRCLFTWPAANTAVADEMKLTVHGTFRSVGSGTSAVIEGMMSAEHELTTTGFGGTGLGANIIVNTTGGGFDSTVASSILSVSVNSGTAGAWTFRQCHAILENPL